MLIIHKAFVIIILIIIIIILFVIYFFIIIFSELAQFLTHADRDSESSLQITMNLSKIEQLANEECNKQWNESGQKAAEAIPLVQKLHFDTLQNIKAESDEKIEEFQKFINGKFENIRFLLSY